MISVDPDGWPIVSYAANRKLLSALRLALGDLSQSQQNEYQRQAGVTFQGGHASAVELINAAIYQGRVGKLCSVLGVDLGVTDVEPNTPIVETGDGSRSAE